jgi:hypothetical protein
MTTNDRWFLTMHAWERADEMGFERADIVAACEEAEISYHPYDDECRVYAKGPIKVVANPVERIIVTVLWNTDEDYSRPRLTKPQRHALEALSAAPEGLVLKAIGVPRPVLGRLERRKLVHHTRSRRWYITAEGRKVIDWR